MNQPFQAQALTPLAPPRQEGQPLQRGPPVAGVGPQAQALAPIAPLHQVGQPAAGVDLHAQAQGHRNFASLFRDETKDPFRASWAQVLRRFDDAGNGAEAMLSAALGNTNATSAFLCCATLHPNGRPKVYVVHTLSRYPAAALDGTITPWDNQLFGCLGDQSQDTVATVMIPPTAFAITQDARVYTMEAIAGQVAQLDDQALLPRIGANGDDVEQLRTRAMMYLPSRFAPVLLSSRGFTPKAAYGALMQAFAADQAAAIDLQPLLDWLRLTLHATGNDNAGPPVTSVALTLPLMDEDLTSHRVPIVQRFITPRQGLATGLEIAINNMATAVTNQANEVNRAQIARAIEREAPTTPATKFGLLLPSLKNLLAVQEEEELPEFWFQFASANKKQEFSVLRDYLELYARSEHAFTSTPPILSPKLHSDLATITFVADHDNDLKTGIQPFIAMDGSEEYRSAALE
jgi:hypothetical protein